jgi:hypothetical protein
MAKRSTRVTLSNNTNYTLSLLGATPCHGIWTEPWRPPSQILPKTHGAWQSESEGFLTGTEGWVKYVIQNDDLRPGAQNDTQKCPQELVFIHWDNPFVWPSSPDLDTFPLERSVGISDVTPSCDADKGIWTEAPEDAIPKGCSSHELFLAEMSPSAGNPITLWGGIWDTIIWPAVAALTEINLEFTVGLRAAGSVDQTIYSFHDGTKGLRSLANAARQPSLRKLLNF